MSDQEIRIRISADGAAQAGAAFGKAAGDLGKFGPAGRSATQSLAQVNMQLTDIAVSLGSGQSPFTVLLQQGGQLKDMFGGVGGALRAVGSGVMAALNPVTIATGMVAALGAAAWQGAEESNALRDSLILTGNAAGVTADSLDGMSRRVADNANTTIGSARQITAGLVATGQVGGAAIGTLGTAAALLAEVSGKSADEVVKDFAGMSAGVTDWAAQHNRAWHFVSAAQLEHIRTLEEQGDKTGAMIVVGNALTDHLARQRDNLGYLETAWNVTAQAASGFWDTLKAIGRDDTALDKLRDVRDELGQLRRMAETPIGGWLAQLIYGSEAQAQGRVDTANRDALRGFDAAQAAGADAQEQARLIQQRKELDALTTRLTGNTKEYQRALSLLVEAEKSGNITREQRIELTRKLAEKEGAGVKSAAEAAARKRKEEEERAEREYQAMVKTTIANRAPRLADIEAGGTEQANAAAARNMQQTAADLRRRNDLVRDLGLQLEEETARLNISLIEDDQERGLAQIELERQTMQARLDVLAAGGADITAAQEALNANILAKQAALKDEVSDGWKRMMSEAEDIFVGLLSGEKQDPKAIAKKLKAEAARSVWSGLLKPMLEGDTAALKKLLGVTEQQADAAGAATRSTKLFGGGLEALTGSFTETAQEVWKWVTSLTSDSGSGSGGGGLLGSAMGWLGSLFGGSGGDVGITSGNMGLADYGLGGGRAACGVVMRGRDYWVGEYGPERLRMLKGGNGFITPTGGTPRGGAAAPVVNVTNHFAPGVSPAQFAAGLEQQRKQTIAEVMESAARPGRELWRLNRGG